MSRTAWLLIVGGGALVVAVAIFALLGLAPGGDDALPTGPGFLVPLDARPLLHARLNATSALLMLIGFFFIRRKMVRSHLTCMLLATVTTVVFLVSYLQYHYYAGSTPFQGTGWVRAVYLFILASHAVLAAVVAPLVISLLVLAARRRFDRHRRIARWTLPIWLYVSITGVLVYAFLHIWFPG
jgi:putative membrane protein